MVTEFKVIVLPAVLHIFFSIILRSMWIFSFRMYHGELVIALRIFDWNLCIISMLVAQIVPDSWIGFITALYNKTLLSRLSLEFLFKSQFKFAALILMLVILLDIYFLHVSLLSKWRLVKNFLKNSHLFRSMQKVFTGIRFTSEQGIKN